MTASLQCKHKQQDNVVRTHACNPHQISGLNYMTENEFNELADIVFKRIEQAIDDAGASIECNTQSGVMELEFDDGSKIVINRHSPNQEIWLAARSGGFHYALRDEVWISRRDGSELFCKLEELVKLGSGDEIAF